MENITIEMLHSVAEFKTSNSRNIYDNIILKTRYNIREKMMEDIEFILADNVKQPIYNITSRNFNRPQKWKT